MAIQLKRFGLRPCAFVGAIEGHFWARWTPDRKIPKTQTEGLSENRLKNAAYVAHIGN